ncbi:MAG: hypothetical protein R2800_00470 [Flavipsychrobacter sp.]
MSSKKQLRLLKRLLLEKRAGGKLWLALGALWLSTTLLLFTVMVWWGYQQILADKYSEDSLGSTFITLSKEVTPQSKNQPRATTFTYTEIDAINSLPQVLHLGMLTASKFPVSITLNSPSYGFSRSAFLESIPDEFIDEKPIDWVWQYRNINVPVIVPSSFLELYNYGFALSDGVPQISKKTAMSLAFDLKIGDSARTELFTMNIVGFSDRVNSILVPKTFLDYGNDAFAPDVVTRPSRLILKVKDPSDQQFVDFLKNRNYVTNSELLRWNKLRGIIEVVGYTTGVIALLLLVVAIFVYRLFVTLRMKGISDSLNLLIVLGYSPRFLQLFVLKRIVFILVPVFAASGAFAILAQQHVANWLKGFKLEIPTFPSWPVWVVLFLSYVTIVLLVLRATAKAIKQKHV